MGLRSCSRRARAPCPLILEQLENFPWAGRKVFGQRSKLPSSAAVGPCVAEQVLWSFPGSARLKAAGNAFHWTSICAHMCESTPETGPMCAPSMVVIRSLLSRLT